MEGFNQSPQGGQQSACRHRGDCCSLPSVNNSHGFLEHGTCCLAFLVHLETDGQQPRCAHTPRNSLDLLVPISAAAVLAVQTIWDTTDYLKPHLDELVEDF